MGKNIIVKRASIAEYGAGIEPFKGKPHSLCIMKVSNRPMTAAQKFEKHLAFWHTRQFPKRKGKSIALLLIEAMDRKWKEQQ
jgi:hypothetical protein